LRQHCIVRLICDHSKLRAWRAPGLHGDTPGRGALGPFHEPGEVPPAIVEINLSLNDGEEPADQPALSS